MKISTSIPIIGLFAAIISILILAVKLLIPAIIIFGVFVNFFQVAFLIKNFLIIWGILTLFCSFIPRPINKTYQITLN